MLGSTQINFRSFTNFLHFRKKIKEKKKKKDTLHYSVNLLCRPKQSGISVVFLTLHLHLQCLVRNNILHCIHPSTKTKPIHTKTNKQKNQEFTNKCLPFLLIFFQGSKLDMQCPIKKIKAVNNGKPKSRKFSMNCPSRFVNPKEEFNLLHVLILSSC